MKNKFKITIPEPCNQNWDKMTPDENGRFCLVCNKSVIDFSNKLPDEIQHFFAKNEGQKICGRFKNSQLDSVSVKIPSILYPQTNYHKIFLLALFLMMGNNIHSQIVLGMREEHPNPNVNSEIVPKPIQNITTINIRNYKFSFYDEESLRKITSNNSLNEKSDIKKPYFPDHITKFYTFFGNEYKILESSKNTLIQISFIVEIDGSLTYINPSTTTAIVREEIIRILKLSPKWEPGEIKGQKIRMLYRLFMDYYPSESHVIQSPKEAKEHNFQNNATKEIDIDTDNLSPLEIDITKRNTNNDKIKISIPEGEILMGAILELNPLKSKI